MGKSINILITGGAGFIGSSLINALDSNVYNITVIDNLSKQIHGTNPEIDSDLYLSIKNNVNLLQTCITNKNEIINLITKQDIIVHLAAETGTGQSMYLIDKYVNININGTAIILDILANHKNNVQKFIVASSRAIYGEGKYTNDDNEIIYPESRKEDDMLNGIYEILYKSNFLKPLPTDENSMIHPSSVYGITKQTQEQLVMTICSNIGIIPISLRFQNVYGPGQSLKNPYTGILSIFSTQILNGNPISIFEDGKESRDFIFINDIVDSIILSIESKITTGEIYNVGTGIPTTVLNVAQTLIEEYKINIPINITGNFRIGDIRHNYADISKIKSQLNFEPKYSFKQGIKIFTNWVSKQKINNDNFTISINEMKNKGIFK